MDEEIWPGPLMTNNICLQATAEELRPFIPILVAHALFPLDNLHGGRSRIYTRWTTK